MASDSERAPLLRESETAPCPVVGNASNDEISYAGHSACDPRHRLHRFLILIIMCFLCFGSYFCYDNPAALQDVMERELSISTSTFMSFYAWYSWPNVVLSLIGGFLMDRVFGIRLGAIIFGAFVTIGQLIFATGALFNMVWLMTVGRFTFGIGGESLAVAQNTYAVSWFKNKELNLVFGVQLSFSRVGSMVTMYVMEPLFLGLEKHTTLSGYRCLGVALFIAASTCLFSLGCALAMAYYDRRAKRILNEETGAGDVINLKDIKDFPAEMWIICCICVFYYVAVFPLVSLGLVFFEMKWSYSPAVAGITNSLVYFVSIPGSVLCGFLIDRYGRNLLWIIAGVILTIGCHSLLAFTFLYPFIPMAIMGLALSMLAAALWPLVALVVPENQLGTAYGIMQSVQNLGLAVCAIIAGKITDSRGYLMVEVFFIGCLFAALISAVMLYLVDASRGGMLNLKSSARSAMLEEQKRLQQLQAETSRSIQAADKEKVS